MASGGPVAYVVGVAAAEHGIHIRWWVVLALFVFVGAVGWFALWFDKRQNRQKRM